jgi:hypothetical protein
MTPLSVNLVIDNQHDPLYNVPIEYPIQAGVGLRQSRLHSRHDQAPPSFLPSTYFRPSHTP